jgi:hypothetical protein
MGRFRTPQGRLCSRFLEPVHNRSTHRDPAATNRSPRSSETSEIFRAMLAEPSLASSKCTSCGLYLMAINAIPASPCRKAGQAGDASAGPFRLGTSHMAYRVFAIRLLRGSAQHEGQIGAAATAAPQAWRRWTKEDILASTGCAAHSPGQGSQLVAITRDSALLYRIGTRRAGPIYPAGCRFLGVCHPELTRSPQGHSE